MSSLDARSRRWFARPVSLLRLLSPERRRSGVGSPVTDSKSRPLLTDGGEDRPGFVGDDADPLLTDKERVRRAIASAGGRMRQQELLDRSGWTKARVSRLLTAMVEDGSVVKIRVGRENVLCLQEAVPDFVRDGNVDDVTGPDDAAGVDP